MVEIKHRNFAVNNIRIHIAEAGVGPTVLMIHGFPESWYSWRNQLQALAEQGYHAVAMDVRGYGRSSKPSQVEDYRMLKIVADVVAVAGALDNGKVILVGHDWGAPIAWNSALLRPDIFSGVAGLSVPFSPGGGLHQPTKAFAQMPGNEFYMAYFQQVGRAEKELEADIKQWLLGFYWCAGGDINNGPDVSTLGDGGTLKEKFMFPDEMPSWLTHHDLEIYSQEFEYSGFYGPLNRYRNLDRDWHDLSVFAGQPITIPAMFIGGERDGPTIWGAAAIDKFSTSLPKLFKSEILPGAGHWIQQERADRTNELLLEFFATL
ncbi:MAG: alpha/beta hydrolase [Pseudomonadales bacterium]|nr:alpha/beta hydrolase [Pseudomonadales bacterium]